MIIRSRCPVFLREGRESDMLGLLIQFPAVFLAEPNFISIQFVSNKLSTRLIIRLIFTTLNYISGRSRFKQVFCKTLSSERARCKNNVRGLADEIRAPAFIRLMQATPLLACVILYWSGCAGIMDT